MNIHLRTGNAKLSLEQGCISIFTLAPGTKPGSDRRGWEWECGRENEHVPPSMRTIRKTALYRKA